jgi:hypothetical protein
MVSRATARSTMAVSGPDWMFLLCSYGFQRPFRESSGFVSAQEKNLFLDPWHVGPVKILKESFTFP